MSEQSNNQPFDHLNESQSFYNQGQDVQKKQQQDNNKIDNIPSKSDVFKKKKIHKSRGHGLKKPKTSKQQQAQHKRQQQATQSAQKIIQQMDKKYQQDKKLYKLNKPAGKKLLYLPILKQKLKNPYTWDKFLQQNGLQRFQLWFARLPEGIQPSLTLRKGLLQILDNTKIKSQYISKVSEIQGIVKKHKKSQTKQLRELSESILMKWSRTLHEDLE